MEPAAFLVYSLETQYKCLFVKLMEQGTGCRIQGTDQDEQNPCHKFNLIVMKHRFSYTLPNAVIYGIVKVSYKP